MFTALVQTGGQTQHLLFAEAWRCNSPLEAGLPFGQRPGLVDDQRIDLRRKFSIAEASRNKMPWRCRRPVATMIDMASPAQRAGQAMMRTETAR